MSMHVQRCEFVNDLPCREVSGELTRLKAENESFAGIIVKLEDATERLEAENDALRELVRDMYEKALCFYVGTGSSDDLQEIRDRMGELGVDA